MRTDVEPTHPRFCTADHLVPEHAGGKTEMGNIVAACRECNNGRHDHITKRHDKSALVAGDDTPRSPFEALKEKI
jgi:5-methylcytosine-specific restriction endonuclease McrA